MPQGNQVEQTQELTLSQINEVAKTTGIDSFQVRISRRPPGSVYHNTIAIFEDAAAEHLTTPEPWLGRLAGGGAFLMTVNHASDRSRQIGGPIIIQATGDAKNVNPEMPGRADWNGPRGLIFPSRTERPAADAPMATFNAGDSSIQGDASHRSPGQGAATPSSPSNGQTFEAARYQLDVRREELERRIRLADEDRHKIEVENMRVRQELELAKVRTELAEKMTAMKPANDQGQSMIAQLMVTMQTAAAENTRLLVTMMQDSQKQSREMMLEMARSAEKTAALLAAKPAIDPIMERLLETKEMQAKSQIEMMSGYTEAIGSSINMAVSALHAVQEVMQPQESEPVWLKATREVLKGISALKVVPGGGMTATRKRPRPQVQVAPAPAAPPSPVPQPLQPQNTNGKASPPAFAGIEQQAGSSGMTPYQEIIRAIREKRDANIIAQFFIANIDDPSIRGPLDGVQGNILLAFAPALEDWLKASIDNQKFVAEQLLPAVQRHGAGRVVIPEAAEAEPEEEEDEEDVGEEPNGNVTQESQEGQNEAVA